jgi:hypothetical protein
MNKRLNQGIRNTAKQGKLINATVIAVHQNRASVRLGGTGAVIHNLQVTGGPVYKGNTVSVDFTTPEPTVVAMGRSWVTREEMMRELAKLQQGSTKSGFTWRILRFAGGYLAGSYSSDGAGFGMAVEESGDGDTILIPPGEIVSDPVTLLVGVCIAGVDPENSIVNCEITLADRSKLTDISVVRAINDSVASNAVIGPVAGKAFIHNSQIMAFNCGVGNATGIQGAGGTVECSETHFAGESMGGQGIAVTGASGPKIRLFHCTYYGSTSDIVDEIGNVEVYSVTQGSTRIRCTSEVQRNTYFNFNWGSLYVQDPEGLTSNVRSDIAELTAVSLLSGTYSSTQQPVHLSGGFAYYTSRYQNWVNKYTLSDGTLSDQGMAMGVGNPHWSSGFIMYDEDTAFAIMTDEPKTNASVYSLVKISFSGDSYEVLHTFNYYQEGSGTYLNRFPYIVLFGDKIGLLIFEGRWYDATYQARDTWLYSYTYDIVSGTLSSQSTPFQIWDDPYHYELFEIGGWLVYSHYATPQLDADGKYYVFTAVETMEDDDGDSPGATYNPKLPLVIFDIPTNTIEMKYWTSLDENNAFSPVTQWTGIDRTNGIIYAFTNQLNSSGHQGILSYNIGSDTWTVERTWSGATQQAYFAQGTNGVKVLFRDDTSLIIKDSVSSWTTLQTLTWANYLTNYFFYHDMSDGKLWLYDTAVGRIRGYDYNLNTFQDVTVTGITGAPNRWLSGRNYHLVVTRVGSPGSYTYNYYILR